MTNKNSSSIVGQRFIVPYSSSSPAGSKDYRYCYWSLKDVITLSAPEPFFTNDIMLVKEVNTETNTIYLESCGHSLSELSSSDTIPCMLVLVSNDIPLDEDEDYTFSYQGCEHILHFYTTENGNKIYSFALKVNSLVASVRGYCSRNRNNISFQVFCSQDKEQD